MHKNYVIIVIKLIIKIRALITLRTVPNLLFLQKPQFKKKIIHIWNWSFKLCNQSNLAYTRFVMTNLNFIYDFFFRKNVDQKYHRIRSSAVL